MTMMVPQELATEILSCLPIKSLMRFKCTSTSWYHLINSPFFVNLHLTTASKLKGNNNYTILTESANPVSDLDQPTFSLVSGDTFHVIREVTLPFFGKSGFSASGPCNGLFCLIGNHHPFSHDIALWNPSTRKLEILPSPPTRTNLVIAFGFGFIRSDSGYDYDYDYKVVKIVLMSMSSFHAYVYSSKKKCWAQVAGPPPSAEETLLHTDCHGYHNGSYYWFSLYRNSITILSFDMHSHVFHVGSLPVALPGHRWMVNFDVQNDSIVIVVHSSKEPVRAEEMLTITNETGTIISHRYPITTYRTVPYRGQASFRWYSVLVRDEVSKTWSYGASVKDYSFMHTRVCIDGTAIGHDGDHLVSYDRTTRERKRVRVYFGGRPFTLLPFVESLVSASGGESVP